MTLHSDEAFDKVDHNTILAKLERYIIIGQILAWINKFILDREQIVIVEGNISSLY